MGARSATVWRLPDAGGSGRAFRNVRSTWLVAPAVGWRQSTDSWRYPLPRLTGRCRRGCALCGHMCAACSCPWRPLRNPAGQSSWSLVALLLGRLWRPHPAL